MVEPDFTAVIADPDGGKCDLGDYLGGKCTEQRVAVEDVQNVAEGGGLSIWGAPCHHAASYTSSHQRTSCVP